MTAPDRELLEALLLEVRGLRADLARRRGGSDPEADARLVSALAASAGSHVFGAVDVIRHAGVDPDLRAALDGAGAQTTNQVGLLLRRLHGLTVDGFRIVGLKRDAHGRMWQVVPGVGGRPTYRVVTRAATTGRISAR